MSWPLTSIGDVATINPRLPKDKELSGPVVFLPMAAISECGEVLEQRLRPLDEVRKGFTYFERGDVLLAKITPCFENGKAAFLEHLQSDVGFGSTEFHVVRPNTEVLDGKYLFYMLWNGKLRHDGELNMTGSAGQRRVPAGFLERYRIPLPSLPTQRHIANVLEQADSLRRQALQMECRLQELRRSVFLSSVGPEAEGYGAWRVMGVSELASADKNSMRTGPFGSALKHSEFVDSGVAVIGIDNAVLDRFQWKERRYISEEKYKGLKKYQVFPGDVIVTIMGTTGRSAIVPEDVPLAISTKHLATITLSPEKATPEFLKYAIQYHPLIAEQIAAQNKGAVMDGLNLGIIKKLKLPVPPLTIQQKLSLAMKALDAKSETLAKSTENFEQLFNALMQRAFKGELTPKLA